MLSALGGALLRRGIPLRGAAKGQAKRVNATIGIATEGGAPMRLPSLAPHLVQIDASEAVDYAPPAGRPGLRERWREKLLAENPSLRDKRFGLPITTQAITHGLALAGDLFVDPGDDLLLPDKFWENYRLLFEVKLGARIRTFPFFAGKGFDTRASGKRSPHAARSCWCGHLPKPDGIRAGRRRGSYRGRPC